MVYPLADSFEFFLRSMYRDDDSPTPQAPN